MFKFFDSHCHLQFPQFDVDRETILSHMRENGIAGIIVGTDYATSKAAVELAEKHDFLWASVGLHPNDNKDEQFDMAAFEELARNPKVVAIGECGLDYFRSGGTDEEKSAQKNRFEKQIDLAQRSNKTLIIHCRNAHDDMYVILQNYKIGEGKLRVVIHFFTGSAEQAQKYLDLGCYLSFPGPVTYTDMYDGSICIASLDKILSETDAPFAAPVPFRGKRNEPAYVEHVVNKIAMAKGLVVEEVSRKIVENTQKAFNLAG